MGITYSDPIGDDLADFEDLAPSNLDLAQFKTDGTRWNSIAPENLSFIAANAVTTRSLAARADQDLPTAFDFIPAAYHAAILARTSTTDVSGYLQDFIDWLEADGVGIGRLQRGLFWSEDELVIDNEGVTLLGGGVRGLWLPSSFGDSPTEIRFNHTTGDAIRCKAASITLENFRVGAGSTRSASAFSYSTNGIRYEVDDVASPTDRINFPRLKNIHIVQQPGHGLALIGDMVGAWLENVATVLNKGHGRVIDQGDQTGRTNKGRPGITTIVNNRSHENIGHGLCVGHPSNGTNLPYRVAVWNDENYRNALSAGVRHTAHDGYFFGENGEVVNSAFAGVDGSGTSHVNSGLYVAGRHVVVRLPRFVQTDVPMTVGNYGSPITNGIDIHLPVISGGTTRPVVVAYESGVTNVRATVGYTGGFTSFTSTSANVTGYWEHVGNTIYFDGNFSKLAVNGTFDVALTGGDTDIDITTSDTSVSGQIVVTQSSTGDAVIRMGAGGTSWVVGVDNSLSDHFAIQQNTSLNSSAQFAILTTGEVGIGTTSPAQKLDVNGAIAVAGAIVIDAVAGARFPVYTAANIADITHAVNTANKANGKGVYDDTNDRLMIATGTTAASTWKVADASATVTPA